ncbi:MAG: hypothetical protein NF693_09005 [Bombella sp.]|nr:hypothetical protein [Bombella sp.]
MPNYGKSAKSALESIRKAGVELLCERKSAGVYDPSLGDYSTPESVNHWNIFCVILPASVKKFRGIDNKLTDEGLILTKARYLLTAALNEDGQIPEPLPEDLIYFAEGSVWKVIGASPLKPAETALIYQIGVIEIG